MFPTPDLSHLSKRDFDAVYEPAEDTFLLLDALEQDARALRDLRPAICLELGSGTGCVTVFLAKLLAPLSPLFLCTDVSPSACKATAATAGQNEVELVEAVNTWFVDGLARRIEKSVDVLIFNPPYVVTPSDEVYTRRDVGKRGAAIEAAWAGGSDGREVIDMMLDIVDALLSPAGVFYIVLIKQNKPEEIRDILRRRYGLESKVAAQRRAGRENLFIVKFWRSRPTPE